MLNRLLDNFVKFRRDQRGNIAVIFAIACVPLISAVGCAVDYSRAVQLQPNDAEANLGLAKVLMLMNQADKAEPLLQRALQLDPTSAMAHFRLSTLYRQAGRTADANQELEEYQKYKGMKDKLQEIYREMRVEPAMEEPDDTGRYK